ncbi:hypothetical protein MRX96_015241 [Rhipicephalus microplus]
MPAARKGSSKNSSLAVRDTTAVKDYASGAAVEKQQQAAGDATRSLILADLLAAPLLQFRVFTLERNALLPDFDHVSLDCRRGTKKLMRSTPPPPLLASLRGRV